jgi:hypothetical protein
LFLMKKLCAIFISWLFVFMACLTAQGVVDTITPGEFIIDPSTLQCLGFRWYVDGDDNGNATVQVTYRQSGTQQWKQALNMLRVNREFVDRDYGPYTCDNLFAGSILGLEPATSYDVNFVLVDPDGGQGTQSVTVQTISVPIAPTPTKILHVYPPGWSDVKNQPAYDTISAAFTAVKAGEKVLLYPGVHTGNVTINKAGRA